MATCSIGDLSRREILKMSALTGIASLVSTRFAMVDLPDAGSPVNQMVAPFWPVFPQR